MDDVGSLAWGRATGGVLTRAQRQRLRMAVLRDARVYARSMALLALRRGTRSAKADLTVMDMPDTDLCRGVEAAVVGAESPQMLGHSYRTVAYAHALAAVDGLSVDLELLWCACLLHDIGIERTVPGRCFAVRGGEETVRIAQSAGADHATAELLGDAVSRHATADLDPDAHPLPYLVAAGALVDVLGKRLDEMDRDFVRAVNQARPRDDFASVLSGVWRAETRAVPKGRAAVAQHTAAFSVAARFAPL
ncbi:MAG: HD domain-containing protein [Candidatus Nanopelagicales bacterium]|nr:HD domain-containing protein [Actinomycetota bacterium]MCB0920844.1 HD domain-containing protein [Actinomycetota bacterium]HNE87845.1 HD domain-containing protein [Actinomycetota bacterium]HNL51896.1 HD domain-containing protein [Actinomycetota bacterium]HNO15795.1 HD domain-containing protein [Actinomycetota bacterium]